MKKLIYGVCLCVLVCFNACKEDPVFTEVSSIETMDASNITVNSATLNGFIHTGQLGINQIGNSGFIVSTDPSLINEEINVPAQELSGLLSANVNNLKENTTYYYCVYAGKEYSDDVLKGDIKSFTTNTLIAPEGAVRGLFSISDSKKIFFSKGNLQYQASTAKWRFAVNQYDYIGDGNLNVSSTYSGWIDVFGQGTSGFNGRYPYNSWDEGTELYGNPSGDLDGTNYDWGVYNAISNGGKQKGLWRTLNRSEVFYLFCSRPNASSYYSKATIDGTHGLIILPDDWVKPDDIDFSPAAASYSTNAYSKSQWQKMEQNGAVFLPAAGGRCFKYYSNGVLQGGDMRDVNVNGYYRTSTVYWFNYQPSFAYIFNFNYDYYSLTGSNYGALDWAWSVRLVQDY